MIFNGYSPFWETGDIFIDVAIPTHFMMVLCIIVSELYHKLFSLMICMLRVKYINLCAT